MDSKRRMMEINIWNQAFFSQLEQVEKLFYWFVITNCNNIGVYEHNPKLTVFHCGGDVDLKSFTETVNFDKVRIVYLDNTTLWIKDFVRETWGTIAAGNNLGLSAYKLLLKHNLLDRFISECPDNINVQSFYNYKQKALNETEKQKDKYKAYANIPLPQDCGKLDPKQGQVSGNLGAITNSINRDSSITDTPSANDKKKESLTTIAERCVSVFPQSSSEILFSEINAAENKLRELIAKGIDKPEAEQILNDYLKSECMRLKQTDDEYDALDIIESFQA